MKLAPMLAKVSADINLRSHDGSGSHDRQLHQALPFRIDDRMGPESSTRKSAMAKHNRRVMDNCMNKVELPARSGYSHIDQTRDPMAYVRKLDERATSDFWQVMKSQMFALLDIHAGDHVLDVGCGTGDDVRALAQAVGPCGRAVGVDSSTTIITVAQQRAANSGLAVEYYVGDVQHLEFPNESFDCCRAERVLQHLVNPQQALTEMVRVARPGARLVVVEPDYGATKIAGGDPGVTRKLIDHRCAHYQSGRIGMILSILFKRLKLINVAFMPVQVVTTHIGDEGEKLLLENYVEPAIAASVVSEEEGTRWIKDLKAAERAGGYRHALTLFLVRGWKPG
jgi:ubiquinone/menaquinone biosynthesis C-methylase UbiE